MVSNEKGLMNDNDKKEFVKLEPKVIEIGDKKILNIKNKDSYYGLGWSHNFGKPGIWSEGKISTLLFKVENIDKDLQLEMNCSPYINKKNDFIEFEVYVNNIFSRKIKLSNRIEEKLKFLIKKDFVKNNEIIIDFKFKNLISPFEVLESPDARKLGILLKDIKINKI
tara:strand:- start:276 stop:776 length:501 start_codon:yes stop_codon:yes gene_type:complete